MRIMWRLAFVFAVGLIADWYFFDGEYTRVFRVAFADQVRILEFYFKEFMLTYM